jgi:hypothetical protein
MQSDKIQTRLSLHDAAPLPWFAIAPEYWKVNPGKAGIEPRAPDDIRNIENTAVLKQR